MGVTFFKNTDRTGGLTLPAGKNALALHAPRWLGHPLGASVWAGVERGLSPVTLSLYL